MRSMVLLWLLTWQTSIQMFRLGRVFSNQRVVPRRHHVKGVLSINHACDYLGLGRAFGESDFVNQAIGERDAGGAGISRHGFDSLHGIGSAGGGGRGEVEGGGIRAGAAEGAEGRGADAPADGR